MSPALRHWRALLGAPEPLRVLALLNAPPDRDALLRIASAENWRLDFASTLPAALSLLAARKFTAVVCDHDGLATDWRPALDSLVSQSRGAVVILASPTKDDYLWQEVVRRGGYDVLAKPFRPDAVIRSIRFAGRGRA